MKAAEIDGEGPDFSSAENFAKSLTPDLFGFLFAIPALLGAGGHWYLETNEENELSDSSWLMVSALPKTKRKVVEKWVTSYLPIIMFILTFGVITGKRIQLSYEEFGKKQSKGKLFQIKGEPNEPSEEPVEPREASAGDANPPTPPNPERRATFLQDPFSTTYGKSAG